MNKVIGYVGTRDLGGMRNADIRCLDVINIAFGQVEDSRMVWDGSGAKEALVKIRGVNPGIKISLSVGGWGADGFPRLPDCTEQGKNGAERGRAGKGIRTGRH